MNAAGRRIVVTGGNSGIGLEAVRQLAEKGAEVVLACRDRSKGEAAARGLSGAISVRTLDLADLASVRAFAASFDGERVDVLINNAGVMAVPRGETKDGFERQIGTNHLGHFALTALLWPRLREREGARVVTVSSSAHKMGRIDFDDLHGRAGYSAWRAYGQSKLANLLFAFELARKISAAGLRARSVACHPGYAATNLQLVGPQETGSKLGGWLMRTGNALIAQPAEAGAWPTVFAATAASVENGAYIGPGGMFELGGKPKVVQATRAAQDQEVARRLWEVSERETGVTFSV